MSADHDDDAPHEEHEEHANHEAWVIPYADLLTLLMAMFIALFAISQVNVSKAKQVAAGFNKAVGGPPIDPGITTSQGGEIISGNGSGYPSSSGASAQGGVPGTPLLQQVLRNKATVDAQRSAELKSLKNVQTELATEAKKLGVGNELSFDLQQRGLVVRVVSDNVLFRSGDAELQAEGRKVLALVANVLRKVDNPLLIEGHTDSAPTVGGPYKSNWGLSTARAESVLLFLVQDSGLAQDRMRPTGWADLHPVASNETEAGRARNRRVEIVVQSKAVDAALQANGLTEQHAAEGEIVAPKLNNVVGDLANGG